MQHILAKPPDYQPLKTVATLPEAAIIWQIHRNTILYHIIAGTIAADKSAGTWLVSLPSMAKVFGYPPSPLPETITETRFVVLEFASPEPG